MRALRRIATPASIAVAVSGCTYAFDEYLPQKTDAGLSTNADVTLEVGERPDEGEQLDTAPPLDSGVFDTIADTAIEREDTAVDTFMPPEDTTPPPKDAAVDTCACVKYAGGKCKEWSPPDCGS